VDEHGLPRTERAEVNKAVVGRQPRGGKDCRISAGTIVQFSSIGGTPGLGSYQAAKFAVDGFTRVPAAETAPLGVRFLVAESSGFATD
jgi:NAD(P)-dependent dehydrogenase (short-subunit alcohol dehydrogenase family)